MKIGVRTVEEGRRGKRERDTNRDAQRQGRKAKQDPCTAAQAGWH